MKNRRLELVKKKFISDKGMWLAVAFLVFLIVMAVGVKFTDLDPNAMNLQKMLAAPDKENIFGTDELGRDYLTRVIYGARVSLLVGVLAMPRAGNDRLLDQFHRLLLFCLILHNGFPFHLTQAGLL